MCAELCKMSEEKKYFIQDAVLESKSLSDKKKSRELIIDFNLEIHTCS